MDHARRLHQSPRYPADDLAPAVLGPVEVALFENLYSAYHTDAQRLATRFLSDPERAADAVHTAYLEILRYLLAGRRWYDAGDARSVVLRNTRWAALNTLRQSRRGAELSGSRHLDAAGSDDWARLEARALCEQIVGQLRPQDREAIRLHFVEALSHADAAARMGISERAFEGRLYRALRSARRAARGMGVGPAVNLLACLPAGLRTLAKRRPRRGSRPRTGGAVPLRVVGLGAVPLAVAGIIGGVAQPPSAPAAAVVPVAGGGDSIYQSVVVDAIAVRDHAVDSHVALARGRRCRCWLVFWSGDGGISWRRAFGPELVPPQPQLAVSQRFPADGRLFIEDASGRAVLESDALGAPFQAARQPVPAMAPVPHEVQGGALSNAGSSFQLTVGQAGLCSSDQGASWRPGCAPQP
jgi:RNA polymerase sigma factor (sigma-70 family)